MAKKNVIIIGAAGRDFHNFNTYYRNNESYNVVAFTAAQIPDIDGRKYPAELAGKLYPAGIPIFAEQDLPRLIKELKADICIFSYSDVPYAKVMAMSAIVNAAGADFGLLGPKDTQVKSTKPVIAVVATRTGCGKSQTSRKVIEYLMEKGLKVVAVRHPMPYGDLNAQKVQRFATVADLAKHKCTVEEMEEYEPHVVRGNVIYAGVDYEAILREAEKDPSGCDVILWDGGNNDFPFFVPDLTITVADPHRPGHELSYYPGEVNLRIADAIVINKMDSASPEGIQVVRESIAKVNPNAIVIDGASPIKVDKPELIKGKRVLVVEDGPTLTHGEMKIGAGIVAAQKFGAAKLVDPRPFVVGKLAETFRIYPNIGTLLPAMGYGAEQLKDLETTINNTDCDSVVIGTPIDLNRIVKINKPNTRVYYDLQEIGLPNLDGLLTDFIAKHKLK
ncbi:MAG TPA: GTPase [Marinilabiliales bacterium]|nr:cyclic 2,3-diphosphoglycerate synthase [Salinivirgaceae bacterium]OFX40904.1 MAG: GTPase [Bacteroidetes bacterium GWA2_40_14]OFX61842.1 MAG: GTPase [Bacteroidetes bacterium GWC2_40_13]OFX75830.1 MAG: GTPase [Bacteroidetes bacterium GWD2_40_43]OFX95028.1 MAG: GTPase [Bacteroidetes bacterium GWE2_40_63]OFY23531.1 MAG: GTPase [Bacteroidetes bacterium GWF2_40_13]OFZ29463.1 MAG: GTPase [Bacteroidetes bacterium RIFOXYC2_FULL_40_12]HAM98688.1 GTPase [Marinilabiliales bacterium]